jgi:hypothetical protein
MYRLEGMMTNSTNAPFVYLRGVRRLLGDGQDYVRFVPADMRR